ncbi:hypothetical protein FHS26_006784 [Rhizobium pisi]|uniref:Uncharacterized protein n=2 Tax=Rhizobium TaxID=379 RepID=A0A7W6BF99_9HYPH|nr:MULTISPECIES: hypothetical protein [Rhizobium]MBB3139004.1 hypothetical protein [Rhizobium pisi]MBB3917370.1 hypothetical protein [Rhizobium fabae]RSB59907.1 hypothetical protein EFD55_32135 [Rhizobium pisi]RUM10184.1 hypothetical protein EFB14_23195 [Rhizobium fabae]TCA48835.1 hypothetical protein E0J16_25425 [Rhizobium pisi]
MFSIAGMFFIEMKEVKRTPEEVEATALLMGIDVRTMGHLYVIRPPASGLESVELFVAAIMQSNPTGDTDDDI